MKSWFLLLLLLALTVCAVLFIATDFGATYDDGTPQIGDSAEQVPPKTGSTSVTDAPDGASGPGSTREVAPAESTPKIEPSQLLLEGSRVEGRVVDRLGQPLEGITVSLFAIDGSLVRIPRPLGKTTRSASDGSFEFGDLPAGVALGVSAESTGLARVELEFEPPLRGETRAGLELRLESAIVLRGVVRGARKSPLAGAEVRVEPARSSFGMTPASGVTATTDAFGGYAIDGLARTLYRVVATAPGHAPTMVEKSLIAVTLRPEARLDIDLDPLVGIARGRVVDDEGGGVAAATIVAVAGEHQVETTSAADGTFALEQLAEREYSTSARANGMFSRGETLVRPGTQDVKLRLGRNGAVIGRAAAGNARTPARIVAELFRVGRSKQLVARNVFESAEFRFDDVVPGRYLVAIEADGAARTESAEIEVDAGGAADLGSIALASGGTVEARLRGARDGVPLSLVRGDLSPANPAWMQHAVFAPPNQRALTRGGAARFEHVLPGVYTLFAVPEKGLPSIARGVEVREGETTSVPEFEIEAGGAIVGRALDLLGAAVVGRAAIATGPGGERRVEIDDEGYFAFGGLSAGDWSVTVSVDDTLRGRPRPALAKVTEGGRVEVEVRIGP